MKICMPNGHCNMSVIEFVKSENKLDFTGTASSKDTTIWTKNHTEDNQADRNLRSRCC